MKYLIRSRSTRLLIWALMIGFSGSLTSCLSYEDVTIGNVQDVKVKNFSKAGIEVEVAIPVTNPNRYKISIVDSDLNINLNGKDMGKARFPNKITVPAKSDGVQRFTIEADYDQSMKGGLGSLLSLLGNKDMQLHLTGDIKAKAGLLRKSFPVDIKERITL
ncbi:MAG: LEA type 2 family protein [Bacteroidota bacterium]